MSVFAPITPAPLTPFPARAKRRPDWLFFVVLTVSVSLVLMAAALGQYVVTRMYVRDIVAPECLR